MRLVHQYLLESEIRTPEKHAVVCDGRALTYAALNAKINALADMFIVEGLRKGDRVLIMLRDKLDCLVAEYAVMRSGGISVPVVDPGMLETVQYIARDCAPIMAITGRSELAQAPLLRERLTCRFFMIDEASASPLHQTSVESTERRAVSGARYQDGITKLMDLREGDGAVILYTANLDGRLRGALFTHHNLIESTLGVNTFTRIGSDSREFIALPVTQSMGFGRSRCVLFAGGTVIMRNGRLTPQQMAESILAAKCTGISSTPEILTGLADQARTVRGLGEQITFIELGAASMPRPARKKLMDAFPRASLYCQYGLTEAPRSVFTEFNADRKKPDTIGRAVPPAEIFIVDEAGNPLTTGLQGEIAIKGAHISEKYWNGTNGGGIHGGETRSQFRTGDIGTLDKEGYLRVLGRKDEMISLAGSKISPAEVEEKIHEIYPDVELCVLGIPDPAGVVGEIPVLCYIARNGKTIISSELSAALGTRLDSHKIPRIVYRVEKFPRSDSKILRQELRRQLLEGIPRRVGQAS